MKIWHFSDTHTFHSLLTIPEDIDIAIFSGDCSNPKDPYTNEQEVLNFLCWYGMVVKAKYKIFVAGNHDTSIEKKFVRIDKFEEYGIIYLENSSVEIEGIKIWGSPITPTFGEWAFMKARDKLYDVWQSIPSNSDIVVVHGPPKGVLDFSYNRLNVLESCGCNALKNRMLQIQPTLMCFGHIHNHKDIINAGWTKLSNYKTVFSNGSVVTDGKFGKLSSNGNILEI
jgi:Icc-related predicted phosphoesterase